MGPSSKPRNRLIPVSSAIEFSLAPAVTKSSFIWNVRLTQAFSARHKETIPEYQVQSFGSNMQTIVFQHMSGFASIVQPIHASQVVGQHVLEGVAESQTRTRDSRERPRPVAARPLSRAAPLPRVIVVSHCLSSGASEARIVSKRGSPRNGSQNG
jgi:hypothetical protein